MADADNIGRINIWRNSTIATSAATVEPGTQAFGRMSIYRTGALARSHRHHEVPAGGGGGGYTGPLDLVSGAVVAYSAARALSSAMRGQPVYTIREDDGDTTQSFSSDATTGAVDAAAISAFLDGADGFVTLLNDQSGNDDDVVQAIAANQPAWSTNALASKPTMGFYRGDMAESVGLVTAGDVTVSNDEITTFVVVKHLSAAGANLFPWGMNGNAVDEEAGQAKLLITPVGVDTTGYYFELAQYSAPPDGEGLDGYNNDPSTGNLFADAIFDYAQNATGGTSYLNGVLGETVTVDVYDPAPATPISAPLWVGRPDNSVAIYRGYITEIIIYPTKLSDANRLAIRQNIAAYYGISL